MDTRPFDWPRDKPFDWNCVKAFDWHSERPFIWHPGPSLSIGLMTSLSIGIVSRPSIGILKDLSFGTLGQAFRLAWKGILQFSISNQGSFVMHVNCVLRLEFGQMVFRMGCQYKNSKDQSRPRAIRRTPSRPFEGGHQEGIRKKNIYRYTEHEKMA